MTETTETTEILSMSALLEYRDQDAKVKSMINKPSSEAELIALIRRAWRLYDNIFDEGKKISLMPQSEEKVAALHDIRTTRQLLRDEIIRQTIDEPLILALEQRLKELYNRDITDTEVKFDLSGTAVGAMKFMLQTLEKNYKIHSAVVVEIMRLPNPAAAFAKLFNMILEASDLSGEPESIIKALTELLHHENYNGYASKVLNDNLNIAQALQQKLGSAKKYAPFLAAVDHAHAVEPREIYTCHYLPLEAAADQEEIFVPEKGDLGLDFPVQAIKPAPAKVGIMTKIKESWNKLTSVFSPKKSPAAPVAKWEQLKRFAKENKLLTAVCVGLVVLGVAAAVTTIVLSAGIAAVPIAASVVAGASAIAATSAIVLKSHYDSKTAQWQSEANHSACKFEYQDPTPSNTIVYHSDHPSAHSASLQKTTEKTVAVNDDNEDEGDGESFGKH